MTQSQFKIRGVIEGFYGTFYTFPERNDLIRFIGRHGYNMYIYAPKNDRQHRMRWRESYPPEVMEQFAETATIAEESGLQFCYAISPIDYDAEHDFPKLTRKLQEFYECGIRAFSLLVDDLDCDAHARHNCELCEWSAAPHITLCNQLYNWLTALDPSCTLSMCPTVYHGQPPFRGYLHELGAGLHPAVDVFYTGPDVCSPQIGTDEVDAFADTVGRAPLLWDNYPVNDQMPMQPYLHIGPICGRDPALHRSAKGVVVNTMIQAQASKIALCTFADYFNDPYGYAPWRSWEHALREVGGHTCFKALHLFAENSLYSCLDPHQQAKLERLAVAAVAELQVGARPSTSRALCDLSQYLSELDHACYFLKYRMPNLRLRDDLLPWIEALDRWIALGKRSIQTLEALEQRREADHNVAAIKCVRDEIAAHGKRIAGNAVLPLAKYVLDHVEQVPKKQTINHAQQSMTLEITGHPFPWLLAYFRQIYEHRVDLTQDGVRLFRLSHEKLLVESLHLAYSYDGLNWTPLNCNQPILSATEHNRRIRDPFIQRGPDGDFHLLATGGDAATDIYYARSSNLIHWVDQRCLPVMRDVSGAQNAWAPEFVFDPEQSNYLVFWSSSFGRHGWDESRIWCARTEDFYHFSPPHVLFDPGFTVIDATIVPFEDTFYIFFKDERFGHAHGEHRYIQLATAPSVDGPYEIVSGDITPSITEGPAVIRSADSGQWFLFYDHCMDNRYGVAVSQDLLTWQPVNDTNFPPNARHGSVVSITEDELRMLREHFAVQDDIDHAPCKEGSKP